MTAADIGTEKTYFDMRRAESEGFFGAYAVVWGNEHWHTLLDKLVTGLNFTGKEWDDLAYHPTMWHAEGEARSKATQSQKSAIAALRVRAEHPTELVAHLKS